MVYRRLHCPCSSRRWTRFCSTQAAPLVTVSESSLTRVPLVQLHFPPQRTLASPLMAALLKTIGDLCNSKESQCNGILFTSASDGTFCGEFDLADYSDGGHPELLAYYWSQFQQLFTTLHTLPVPTAVAINGHAGTAGVALALGCDYRVMRVTCNGEALRIGLPSVLNSTPITPSIAASLERVVGFRKAEDLLLTGRALTAHEASLCGLVDEAVESGEECVASCLTALRNFIDKPSPLPFWVVKEHFHRAVVAPLCTAALRSADIASVSNTIRHQH